MPANFSACPVPGSRRPADVNLDLYNWLADAVLILHFTFVLFVVAGQIVILIGWARGWGWTRNRMFRMMHLGAIAFVVLEAWFGVTCPLTVAENWLRAPAGTVRYDTSFIGYWLGKLLYYRAPAWVFTAAYTTFAAVVVLTYYAYRPRRRS